MTSATTTTAECPGCGKKAKAVKPLTLRALLKGPFTGQVAHAGYHFCDAQDCTVIYFGQGQSFTASHLRVSVGLKEATGERPLCYCFDHSVASIKGELRTKG